MLREISFDDLPDDLIPKPKFSQPAPAQEVSFDDLPEAPTVKAPEISMEEFDRLTNQPAFGYQQPVGNLLNKQPAKPTMAEPSMKEVPSFNPAKAAFMQPPPVRPMLDREANQNLQDLSEKLPLSSEEMNSAAFKGFLGALPGAPKQRLSSREEDTGGAMFGSAIPGALLMATGAGVPAAMTAYGMEEALKGGGINQDTGAPNNPVEMAVQGAIGTFLGSKYGQSLPGIIAGFGGIGVVQSAVEERARQLHETGRVSLDQANNPEFLKSIATSVIQGFLMGPMAMGHGSAEPQARRPAESGKVMTPQNTEDFVGNMAWREEMGFRPKAKINPEGGSTKLPETEIPFESSPETAPIEAAPVPEDMPARQWQAGNEAQTRILEAEAAHEPVRQEHEANLRAAVEAENALRSRFPDEGVSPKYPAERDLLRALTNKYQEAEAKVSETQNRFDETRGALEEAKKRATQAQETPIPKMSPERLQGRQQVIKAMQDRKMTPEQIQTQIGVMDHLPQLYDGDMRAASLSEPGMMEKLGLGPDVSQETTALRKQATPETPRISLETVDFGEDSPFQAKFPEIQKMNYTQKVNLSRKMADFTAPIVEEVTGVKGRQLAPDAPPGFWESHPSRPNTQFEADVPYEKMKDVAAAHGYLHQQDAVFVMKERDGGKKFGANIAFEGGRPSPEKLTEFWTALRREAPDFAIGGMPTPEGLLIARDEPASQAPYFQGKYSQALENAAEAAGLKMHVTFRNMDWDLVQSGGWKGKNGGQGYLGRFPERERQRLNNGHTEYENNLRGVLGKEGGSNAFLQERDPAHWRPIGNGPGELHQRFGVKHEDLAGNTPEAAKSVYKALGSKTEDRNTAPELKIYDLKDEHHAALEPWLKSQGWNYKVFGPDQETGKFVPPNFKDFSYNNKHVWIFSPWTEHGSFKDTEYTRLWRVTHEVAHAQTNDALNEKYGGIGKRQGALGVKTVFNGREVAPLSLADGMKALEWEHETFKHQREILEKDFGVKITEDQFRKENSINMSDALYRVLSGDFSNPGENGLVPSTMNPDQVLSRAKEILRSRAKDLGLSIAEDFKGGEGKALFQQGEKKPAEPFFHQLQRTLEEKMPPRATPEQIRGILKGRIKTEEIEASGLEDFLSGKEKVNKAELLSYLKENEPKIELDVRRGSKKNKNELAVDFNDAQNKYQEFQLFVVRQYGRDSENIPESVKAKLEDMGRRYHKAKADMEDFTESTPTKFDKYVEPNGRDYKETLYKSKSKKETDLESEIDKASAEVERRSLKKVNAMAEWKRVSEENGNNGSKPVLEAYQAYEDAKSEWRNAVDAFNVLDRKKGKGYESPHFENADETVAHSRSAKFTDENGLKLHHVEEIQSDLHQKGREEGYKGDPLETEGWTAKEGPGDPASGPVWEIRDKNGRWILGIPRETAHNTEAAIARAAEISPRSDMSRRVPDAPFKKSWHEMVIRRELYEAAKNGDDAMTWTGGEKQADRYDLGKQIDNLEAWKHSDGTYSIRAEKGKREVFSDEGVKEKDLGNILGKELAEKIVRGENLKPSESYTDKANGIESRMNFSGLDLKVGGQGMKGFYDKIVPDYLNKYAKKWGVKVETFKTGSEEKYLVDFEDRPQQIFKSRREAEDIANRLDGSVRVVKDAAEYQGIRITPEMRRSILEEGQSFFQKNQEGRDVGEVLGAYIPKSQREKAVVLLFEGANFSTVWHEQIGHSLYHEVIKPDTKLSAEADRLIIRDLGESAIKDGKWTTDAHEWMAKKVEQWAFDGKTNVPTLIPLFKKIMAWMRDVYKDMAGGPTGKELDAEWRQLMDRAFGGEKAKATPEEVAPLKPSEEGPKTVKPSYAESKSNPKPIQGVEPTEHVPGERSLPKTLEKYGVEGGKDREYEVKHLDESAKAAIDEIKEKGAETVQQAILGRAKFDPQDMPRAIALMRQWQYEADSLPPGNAKNTALEKTIQMASEMSKRATEAGQFNAMIRILERLSPDGIVYYAQKQLEKINAKLGPSKHVKMNPETATVLRNAAKELESSRELADQSKSLETVSKKIEKGEQISVDDIAALESFQRKLSVHLGELPPERPKGILGTPGRAKPEPKPASKPAAKPSADNAEAVLEARENAALARLKARGLKPSKALLQSTTKLAEEDISDLADVFASRLAKRKASVSDIKQNFAEAFGPDVVPHLDEIAQKGARRLQEARRERVKLTEVSKRVDEILEPLLKGKPAEIHQAEQLKSAFEALKTLTGDAKREAGWDIQEALGAMVPANAGKKAATILAMAQLLNPKTVVRNVLGNELFYHAERASKWVAANGIDWARSKLTGTDRLITFRTGGQGEYWKNLMLGSKAAMRGVNPEGLESKYDLHGSTFKDSRNPFYWAERAMGLTLRATDYAAYKRAFGQTLGEIAELSADRKKIPSGQREAYIEKWMEDAPPEVLEIADAYGKYATFQDPTALAKGASGLKNFLNAGKNFGLGNFIINYPKTPANILMRAIEYSPAGLLRSLHLISEPWRNGLPRNTREVELSLGRVLVGGAGGMLAWYLAKAGALTGQTDKDRDARNFKKEQTGESNYQVNVSAIGRWLSSGLKKDQLNKRDGDSLISYDWAQPLAINAAMTATAVQALSDKKRPIEGAMATAEAGLEGATKTLEEQPLLQGMEKLFNSDKSIPGRLMEVLEGVPASFSPTLLNQIRQLKDNTARDTQAPTAAARMINKVMYRLPFLSEKLPAIYKTIGESAPREMYQNGNNTLFNVFLNPAFTAKYKVDPSIEVILNPYTTEGRKNQFPKSVYERQLKYTEKGEQKSYDLTGAELSELQRRTAQETFTRFKSMHIENLKDRSPEYQEKVLADGVNDSWNKVRKQFLREKGIHVK